MSTEIIAFAEEAEWEELLELLEDNPEAAKEMDNFGMLPLHWSCTEQDTPIEVIRALVDSFPEACEARNQSGLLPLHIAIDNKLPGLCLEVLLIAFPEASLLKDPNGRYPTELALQNQLPEHSINLIKRASHAFVNGVAMQRSSSTMDVDSERANDRLSAYDRASEFAKLMDDKLPKTNILPLEDVDNLSVQLTELMGQLRHMSMLLKVTSPTHSSSASTVSSTSSSTTCSYTLEWSKGTRLGISFEALDDKKGAIVKRITGNSETLGIEQVQQGDILYSINGKPLREVPFTNIIKYLQVTNTEKSILCFQRPQSTEYPIPCTEPSKKLTISTESDDPNEMYSKICVLLEETLSRVSQVEDTVRMSAALSISS